MLSDGPRHPIFNPNFTPTSRDGRDGSCVTPHKENRLNFPSLTMTASKSIQSPLDRSPLISDSITRHLVFPSGATKWFYDRGEPTCYMPDSQLVCDILPLWSVNGKLEVAVGSSKPGPATQLRAPSGKIRDTCGPIKIDPSLHSFGEILVGLLFVWTLLEQSKQPTPLLSSHLVCLL